MSCKTQKPAKMSSELSTGKTIVILAVVVGCFAVLWPKVFYPMLTSSMRPSSQAPSFRDAANAHYYKQLCYLLSEKEAFTRHQNRLTEEECFEGIRKYCRVKLTEPNLQAFRLSKDKTNLTHCLNNFQLDHKTISSAAPPTTQSRSYKSNAPHPHARPERPVHLHPETMHPALREKGRPIPHRTIEKQARPGPMPGIRPPMGGGGHMSLPQTKGSGAMGIIMPIYTVGIIIFFVYTIMKVLFKRDSEEEKTPKLKDFHLDPEYRKYVFAEEYLDNSSPSHRDHLRRHERETSKHRRRQDAVFADTKIEDEQMDQLRRRLEDTESAMERLMSQMGSVTDKLTAAKITEVLTQAQAQARILKDDDDDDASDIGALTISEDFSLPLNLQQRLEELNINDIYMKGTYVELDDGIIPGINNILTGNEVADLENCIDQMKVLSENLAIEDENDLGVIASADMKSNSNVDQDAVVANRQLHSLLQQDSFDGPSDIAQRDSADNLSDGENHSGASETGADISELNTYADEGVITLEAESPPAVIEELVPEAKYVAPIDEDRTSQTIGSKISLLRPKSPSATEQGTQTESAKKMSVMDLQTTYMLKEQAMHEASHDSDGAKNINEIILDATLPIDTQLLIKDSHLDALPSNKLLIGEANESELLPYVITSQVQLAFVGLEQADSIENAKFIVPERRDSPCPSKNVSCALQNMPNDSNSTTELDRTPLSPLPAGICHMNGHSSVPMTENTSVHQPTSEQICKSSMSDPLLEKCGLEATAMVIVREATEESLKILSKGMHRDKLSRGPSDCVNAEEGNAKSDAEKVSSGMASNADLEDYEILPKSDEISGDNTDFLRVEEGHKMDKMGNQSS